MIALKAHVKDGRIVLDEPASLEDGTEVVVVARDQEIDMQELEDAIQESLADLARGDFEDASEFVRRLASKP